MEDFLESLFEAHREKEIRKTELPKEIKNLTLYEIAVKVTPPTEIIKYDLDE